MKKLLAISVLLITSLASAESLEERKYWKGQMEYLQQSIDSAQTACDAKFSFAWVDKEKFRAEAEKANANPFGVCNAIVDEVASLCREGDDEKASVKAKIKGFQCGYAKPRKLDLSKAGTVKYMGNNEEANFSDWAKPWLMKRL